MKKEITFVSSVMIRSGKSNLCLRLDRDIQKLVKRGEIYEVKIKKI
jgi:hypothetical protein